MVARFPLLSVLGGLVALGLTGAASAGIIGLEETQSQSFSFGLSPGSAALEFDQFDTAGGTRALLGVELLIQGEIGADVTAENDSPALPAPEFGLNLTGFLDISFVSLGTAMGFNDTFVSDGVDASDGVVGSGSDFWDFGSVSVSDGDSDMTSTGLEPYVGAGTLIADVTAAGGFTVTGSTDSTMVISNFMAAGEVTITYVYELVPAPGALALLGLAGLAGRRRRR